MSQLLGKLEGRERRAECLRNDAAMNCAVVDLITGAPITINGVEQTGLTAEDAERISAAANLYMRDDLYSEVRTFFAECEAEARDVMRGKQ